MVELLAKGSLWGFGGYPQQGPLLVDLFTLQASNPSIPTPDTKHETAFKSRMLSACGGSNEPWMIGANGFWENDVDPDA